MPVDPNTLEPAIRDPKALRRTAIILLVVIIAGGIGIIMAYAKLTERQAMDPRPIFEGRLNENLGVVRQDGTAGGLLDLDGKVWLACAVCVNQPESWARSREVMARLAKHYAGNDQVALVCLTIDPDREPPEVLAKTAKELGAEVPKWWFAAAGQEFVQRYLKDKFRLGALPYQVDGKWVYNPKILVVDKNHHLRAGKNGKAVVEFDFDRAASWDAEGKNEGIDKKTNVETMEDVLIRTVDALLLEPKDNS